MNIQQAYKSWTELGENDPMWVVLSLDDKIGRKWTPEEFFATGREEIQRVLGTVREAGVNVNQGTALDFGCGLGRLTQALANHFQRVDGVDVSASMIRQAQQYNKHPARVEYHLNVKNDMSLFARGRFDFIYSNIVLQHIPTADQLLYITEFMNLLKIGGVAYFQTIHRRGLRAFVPNWFVDAYRLVKHRGKPFTPIYGVPVSSVERVIRNGAGRIERKTAAAYTGWERRFALDFFLVVKTGASS
jgi:SAM-dependent methyltransferase